MADSKEDIIRRGYKAFGEGDMETLGSLYTTTSCRRSRATTRSPVSTRAVDNVLGLYGKLFELSGGTFEVGAQEREDRGRQGRQCPPHEG